MIGLGNGDALLSTGAALVLILCFITGGSSSETGQGVMLAQWLALPLLIGGFAGACKRERLRAARWAVLTLVFIVLLPWLQLLPLPEGAWRLAPARVALMRDLNVAGITRIDYRWSLAPLATERDAHLLLPPAALFICALALSRAACRRLLWCLVALAVFSLALGFAQLAAPQDIFLNPFPQYAPALAGVFANKNHQAGALAIGLVLSLSLLRRAYQRAGEPLGARVTMGIGIALTALFAAVLPLVKSRAGVIIAFVVGGFVFLEAGPLSLAHWRKSLAARLLGLLAGVALLAGIWSAAVWMRTDADVDGSRWAMTSAAFRIGVDNLPFGSGFGSFVPMFEQATHGALMHSGYINNAHDDYVQVWLEGGVLGLVALIAAAVVLFTAVQRLRRLPEVSRRRNLGMAAFAGLLVLLLHSTVDYPLRTPALMAVFGLLAGIVVASAADAGQRDTHDAMNRQRPRSLPAGGWSSAAPAPQQRSETRA